MKRIVACILVTVLLLSSVLLVSCERNLNMKSKGFSDEEKNEDNTIYVDFSDVSGVPLFKKIAMFSVGWVQGNRMIKTLPYLEELRPVTLRLDMGMGYSGMGATVGNGTIDDIKYNYNAMNNFSKLLEKRNIMPYWCYFATPKAVQKSGKVEAHKEAPTNYEAWKEICENISANFKKENINLYGHEIYNEPDYQDMYTGSWKDFMKIYEYGAKGVKKGDPDAVVGGAGFAFPEKISGNNDLQNFLQHCIDTKTPMDFLSYHSYFGNSIIDYSHRVRNVLSNYNTLNNVRLQVTEFNTAYDEKSNCNYAAAAKFFNLVRDFNEIPDLEVVHWALFLSPYDYLGLLSKNQDKRYAPYHAIKFYNNMPMENVKVSKKTSIDCIASVEKQRACAAVFNMDGKDEEVTLLFDNLPFKKGDVNLHIIDKNNSSFYDTKKSDELSILESGKIKSGKYRWTGKIPKYTTVLVEITAPNSSNELDQIRSIGDYVRRDYYFENRLDNVFADGDIMSLTTFLGMNGSSKAGANTSLTFDNVVDVIDVKVNKYKGLTVASEEGYCGIRIDFQTENEYAKSVFYNFLDKDTQPGFSSVSTMPSDKVIFVEDDFQIDVKKLAPDNFTGRVVITMAIKDCGQDDLVKIVLDSKSDKT